MVLFHIFQMSIEHNLPSLAVALEINLKSNQKSLFL